MAKHTCGPYVAEVTNEERDDGYDEITARGIILARVEGADAIKQRMGGKRGRKIGDTIDADALDEVDANARLFGASDRLYDYVKARADAGDAEAAALIDFIGNE